MEIYQEILSNPNPNPNPNLDTMVVFDMKMTVQPPPHTNFSATSRPARELEFVQTLTRPTLLTLPGRGYRFRGLEGGGLNQPPLKNQ